MMQNKKILLGVTGGIAAYKTPELVRLIKKLGAQVRVVMTEAATAFVTPLTLQTLSEYPVSQSLFTDSELMAHIELARWADLILIAPATANFLAKLNAGFADDLLTTICLATESPIMIMPSMNKKMWHSRVTQRNIHALRESQIIIFDPAYGVQACGEIGEGRMLEPDEITQEIQSFFLRTQQLKNKRILITAGPTQEAIDPVRYISNYSSGKMGYAIAVAAQQAGATVTLISGPTALNCPSQVTRIDVTTALQMKTAVLNNIENTDIFISAAAVADYGIANPSVQKIKRTSSDLTLSLTPNTDILLTVSQLEKRPFLIGFAAETENLLAEAKRKLYEKKLDMIIANEVGMGKGFHSDHNELWVLTPTTTHQLPYATKEGLAKKLIDLLTNLSSNVAANVH